MAETLEILDEREDMTSRYVEMMLTSGTENPWGLITRDRGTAAGLASDHWMHITAFLKGEPDS